MCQMTHTTQYSCTIRDAFAFTDEDNKARFCNNRRWVGVCLWCHLCVVDINANHKSFFRSSHPSVEENSHWFPLLCNSTLVNRQQLWCELWTVIMLAKNITFKAGGTVEWQSRLNFLKPSDLLNIWLTRFILILESFEVLNYELKPLKSSKIK